MSQENERLGHLLDQFLTLSRIDQSHGASLQKEPVPPAELARAAAARMETKLREIGCTFEMRVEEPLPPVLADRERFSVALVNLLDNALKYTDADKRIALRVRGV